MNIYKNFSLKNFHTFSINVNTDFFCIINNINNLHYIFMNKKFKYIPKFILGDGSNILFIKHFNGLIIKNNIKGIKIIKENNIQVLIKCATGEKWNDFVSWCINYNFGGLENLSYIPGTVGGAVVQNIGAYGIEVKKFIFALEVYDIINKKIIYLYKQNFWFSYRDSSFKNELKDKYFIIYVYFILKKKYIINISYGKILYELKKRNIYYPNIKDISNIITHIRKYNLLDPNKMGNAGSFFKNPIINKILYTKILKKHPDIIKNYYSINKIKLSAAQLIEKIGLKGIKIGNTGIYNKHALILINYGNATGEEIYELSTLIIKYIKIKFNIYLEREVIIV